MIGVNICREVKIFCNLRFVILLILFGSASLLTKYVYGVCKLMKKLFLCFFTFGTEQSLIKKADE